MTGIETFAIDGAAGFALAWAAKWLLKKNTSTKSVILHKILAPAAAVVGGIGAAKLQGLALGNHVSWDTALGFGTAAGFAAVGIHSTKKNALDQSGVKEAVTDGVKKLAAAISDSLSRTNKGE